MLRNSIKEDLKENFISEEEYWQYNKEYSDKIKKIKEDIIKAHKKYAEEIITMYHGAEFIKQAEERYSKVAKGGIPENIKEVNLSSEAPKMKLCDILTKVEFATSKSEARRMIQGNGVKVNSEVVNDINAEIEIKGEIVIQFGKNKFVKVI